MKHIVVIGDGMADFPVPELQGKTPLMSANKPYMDMMAKAGFCGKVATIPDGMSPGSDVAGMSIFGYDPARYYTGRAPIEAAGMGISMGEEDVAFRCNLVHIDERPETNIMGDYSGGHISTEEARILIESLSEDVGSSEFAFFPGVGYRHIMLWRGGKAGMTTTPPHDITGKEIGPYVPFGEGAATALALMEQARMLFKEHPVNKKRISAGKTPANGIWLWGQGKKAFFPSFNEKYGLTGATVAAVDLIKGISRLVGFDAPLVEGATGYLDTDYGAKARKALELIDNHDIVYIHVEAPDEASHNGNTEEKIKVIGTLYEEAGDRIKFLVVTDHATPISLKTHYACPVPFVVYEKRKPLKGCDTGYDERSGEKLFTGEEMIAFFLRG